MGLTNFPNGISSMGMPVYGSGMPQGLTDVFFVDYGNGSDGVSKKSNSIQKPWKTLAYAETQLTSNKNQGIALIGNSTHTLTEMLTIDKNRCHIFGYDPGGRIYGQNAKVSLGITGVATNVATMLNTGVRNSFSNIKFINNETVAQGLYCVAESGEYTVYNNFEIYKSTMLNGATAAELLLNGDSCQFFNGTIGSLANLHVGNIIRPCVSLKKSTAPSGTKQMRECYFNNVRMLKRSAGTTSAFVWAYADADVERALEFKDCGFINAANSSATPAVAVGGAAALTVGQILLTGNTFEVGCTALATQTGIFVTTPTYAADGGSAIQAT